MTDMSEPGQRGIEPVRVRDLRAFLAAIEPIARELSSGDILGALARHADGVITATAIGAGVERQWLEAQDAGTLVELAAKVMEVNADFFVHRVLPRLTAAAERIGSLTASGGTSGSPGSVSQGSTTGA